MRQDTIARMRSAPKSPEYIEKRTPAPRATTITLSAIIWNPLFKARGVEARQGLFPKYFVGSPNDFVHVVVTNPGLAG